MPRLTSSDVRGGAAVGGSAALRGASRCRDLSRRALQYAASLGLDDPSLVASRLYRFNTCPASPGAHRRWTDAEAVAAFLGLERYCSALDLDVHAGAAWQGWQVRGPQHCRSALRFKLYVSPRAEWTAEVLAEVVPRLVEFRALECKVGRTLHGLLRPDKLMVYFGALPALRSAARRWATALEASRRKGFPSPPTSVPGLCCPGEWTLRTSAGAWRAGAPR